MNNFWGWAIYAWVGLPTVMYGGYALLGLMTKREPLSEFRRTWFRAGHAHAGVLLLMFLLYIDFLFRVDLPSSTKHAACAVFVVGALMQSGGFFIHMARGREDGLSVGTTITSVGALLLTAAIAFLIYGLATSDFAPALK